VKGDNTLEAGTPESFNVLMKEMQSLGLNVRPGSKDEQPSLQLGGTDLTPVDGMTATTWPAWRTSTSPTSNSNIHRIPPPCRKTRGRAPNIL